VVKFSASFLFALIRACYAVASWRRRIRGLTDAKTHVANNFTAEALLEFPQDVAEPAATGSSFNTKMTIRKEVRIEGAGRPS